MRHQHRRAERFAPLHERLIESIAGVTIAASVENQMRSLPVAMSASTGCTFEVRLKAVG